MHLDLLPTEVIQSIVQQLIWSNSSSVVYIKGNNWNSLTPIKELLAFAHTCRRFDTIVKPLLYNVYGQDIPENWREGVAFMPFLMASNRVPSTSFLHKINGPPKF